VYFVGLIFDAVGTLKIEYLLSSNSRTLTSHDPSFIRTDKLEKFLTADRDDFSFNAVVPYQ